MKKNELITKVAKETGNTKKLVSEIVDTIFDTIGQAVIDGDSVNITNFGKFTTRETQGRTCRVPLTGEEIYVKPSRKVTFKVSNTLKDAVKGE